MIQVKKQGYQGMRVIQYDFATISNVNTNEVNIFSGVMPAGRMSGNVELSFEAVCHITTPVISLPNLTLRLRFGSALLTIASGATLGANINDKPFIVKGRIMNLTDNSQFVIIELLTNSGVAILSALSSAVIVSDASWTVDTSAEQAISLTAQFSGIVIGTTTITPKLLTFELK